MKRKLKADWDIVGVCVCECVETWELSVSWKMRKKRTQKGHPWTRCWRRRRLKTGEGQTLLPKWRSSHSASPGPLPTRSPHGLSIQPPSYSLQSGHACSRLSWSRTPPLGVLALQRSLLNSDFPLTQLADHLLWETLLIPALTERMFLSGNQRHKIHRCFHPF